MCLARCYLAAGVRCSLMHRPTPQLLVFCAVMHVAFFMASHEGGGLVHPRPGGWQADFANPIPLACQLLGRVGGLFGTYMGGMGGGNLFIVCARHLG